MNITISKAEYDRIILEKEAAIEGFRGQFELAAEAIKQNDELRQRLSQANDLLGEAHDLLDDVHCYDTDVYHAISKYFNGDDGEDE